VQYLFRVLLVDDVLQKQHEQEIEGLKLPPLDLSANLLGKLNETVSDADISVRQTHWSVSGVEVNIHLRKHLDLVQMRFV
jgi:hypothetical protein